MNWRVRQPTLRNDISHHTGCCLCPPKVVRKASLKRLPLPKFSLSGWLNETVLTEPALVVGLGLQMLVVVIIILGISCFSCPIFCCDKAKSLAMGVVASGLLMRMPLMPESVRDTTSLPSFAASVTPATTPSLYMR